MINLTDPVQILRQMQLQKTIGELNALLSTYYDPMQGSTEEYKKMYRVINDCIQELKDNC